MTAPTVEATRPAENPARETENRGIISGMQVLELPEETTVVFPEAPIEFERAALVLWEDTQTLHAQARLANRFSENYLMYCDQLEKNIRQLGSICLTKAALEQKNMEFPKLAALNLYDLACMAGFHFEKTHAAFQGLCKDNNVVGLSYLDREFRWVNLSSRLKATEIKIQKIKDGTLSVETILKQESGFSSEALKRERNKTNQPQSLRAIPNALPIKTSMAREMARQDQIELRIAIAKRRERVRKIKEAERLERKAANVPGAFQPPKPFQPNKEDMAMLIRAGAKKIRREVEEEMKAEQ